MSGAGFLYLNVESRWPAFQWHGLELGGDGALRLARVPLLAAPAEGLDGLDGLPAPDGPAGVAVDRDGTVFYTDPGSDRLLRIDPCDGTSAPLPCFGGTGDLPTRFRRPRGLLLLPTRRALLVADSGNHRLQLLDPGTFQLLGVWGRYGTEPGDFDTPWTLAADLQGNVYAVDFGNRRVQKLSPRGDVIPGFWENAQAAGLEQPVDVGIGPIGPIDVEVYVLDGAGRIAVFDAAGHLLRRFDVPSRQPLGLLAVDGSLLLGDNAGRRLLALRPDGTLTGEAEGFTGPVAALAADATDGLWLHPGGGAAPVRLLREAGSLRSGVFWGGPFGPGGRAILWHQIETLGGPLAAGAHLQLFVHTASSETPPPAPSDDPAAPFDRAAWTPLPQDALRGLIRGAAASHLWVGAHLTGEGRQTPVVEQVRIDFDTETWARFLPAIYRTRAADPELLERFLSLFESLFTDVEEEIGGLPRRFDAAAAPADWLPWLAGWLGLELDETWPEEQRRRAVAGAFAAAARRGTPAGLREAVRFATGVDVRIAEPVLRPVAWALPADSNAGDADGGRLGFDTVLAAAHPEGAVVGTTAVLDGSYLTGEGGPGSHLYEAVAHQFCVQVYERQAASPRRLAAVRAVIEREKPAHTAWHLCVIAPRLRIGVQSLVGIDTVVAGPPPAGRLGENTALVLGGSPPARLGEDSRIGIGTRLES